MFEAWREVPPTAGLPLRWRDFFPSAGAVAAMARDRGAAVIEDAAQSLGAMHRGTPVGTIGDVGFYSLAAGKGLTLYEGGVLVARDAGLRRQLRETSERIVPRRLGWEL